MQRNRGALFGEQEASRHPLPIWYCQSFFDYVAGVWIDTTDGQEPAFMRRFCANRCIFRLLIRSILGFYYLFVVDEGLED